MDWPHLIWQLYELLIKGNSDKFLIRNVLKTHAKISFAIESVKYIIDGAAVT